MGHRGAYDFDRKTKTHIYLRDAGKYPPGTKLEVDHIVSVRQAKEIGIPAWIVSSAINGQILSRKENRKKADKDADVNFIIMLMSMITKLI